MAPDEQAIDTTAAEAYEAHLIPRIFGPWAEYVVEQAAPKAGEHVLDVACGTGAGARAAAKHVGPGGRIVGLDADPGMLEVARRLASNLATPNEWICESALAMPLADASFDLCLCLQGLQFFPDRAAGLAEFRRVLKPSGRLVASLWCAIEHSKAHHALVQGLESQGVDAAAGRRPFSFGDADEIRRLVAGAGFGTVEIRTEERHSTFPSIDDFIDSVAAGAPSTRHAIAKLSDEARQRFAEDVRERLRPYVTDGALTFPMRTNLVFATS